MLKLDDRARLGNVAATSRQRLRGDIACVNESGVLVVLRAYYPRNEYHSTNINNIRGGEGGKGKEKKWIKKTPKSKKKWSLKKNSGRKNPEE